MSDVIGIAIEDWPLDKVKAAADWLHSMYGPQFAGGPARDLGFGPTSYGWKKATWYTDIQPAGCEDLVMRKDIYFMFVAAFGENYGTTN